MRTRKKYKMINRILIRIKVVQILYSYLLVEKKFTLEDPPVEPTKEKRYAYGLYIDILALLVMISRNVEFRKVRPLEQTRFIARISEDDRIRGAVRKLLMSHSLDDAVVDLADRIKNSGLFKNFIKDSDGGNTAAEDTLWKEVVSQYVMPDARVADFAREQQGYSIAGYERVEEMIQGTLANFSGSGDSPEQGVATLNKSLDQSRELYFRLLDLSDELTTMQEERLEANRSKYLKTAEDLNPNMRFVENRAVAALRASEVFKKNVENINWLNEDPLMMQNLLKAVVDSDIYATYMESPLDSMEADAELWRDLYRKVIFVNPDLLESLEDKSVFWNDDLDIMGTFVTKTFRRIEEGESNPILDKYKDEEDAAFGEQLMRRVLENRAQYSAWISEAVHSSEWDADRLAFMDVVVIMTALAEILNFPKIPLTVSINEYIEIAKAYSSSKSGQFVNGVLATILQRLQKERILLKK